MRDFVYNGAEHLDSRSFVQWDSNNTEIVFFTIFFAFMLHGHEAVECNMTAYGARSESVHILDELHWCVMKASFFVDIA